MRILTQMDPIPQSSIRQNEAAKTGAKGQKRTRVHQRENLSRNEILKRLEQHKAEKTELKAPTKVIKDFEEGEVHEAPGDVGLNNPKDPATREKLRKILSSGGFSFSERERQVLGNILEE
jgi:hypothetical protein